MLRAQMMVKFFRAETLRIWENSVPVSVDRLDDCLINFQIHAN